MSWGQQLFFVVSLLINSGDGDGSDGVVDGSRI